MADPPLFYFGAMSPYSWFAAERIGGLIPDAVWRPVFAGGLFKANGRTSWGLGDEREAKLADCEARAAAHGLGPMRWPDGWPTSDVLVARAMIATERQGKLQSFALQAMRRQFLTGAPLDDPDVLRDVAAAVGLDGARLIDETDDPEVKGALRAATADAVGRGVFGVPTVVIDGELFWGDDRLADAALAAATAG